MDTTILTWFAAHRSAPLDALAVILTAVGRGGLIFAAVAVIRGFSNRRLAMAAWQTVLAVVLANVVADGILKPLVQRPRPFVASATLQVVGERPSTESFPSGHATACVAGALLLASTWPRARAGIWTLAALVALARIYLGVHYPTDVLGGALTGGAVGGFVRGRTVWRWRTGAAAGSGA